MPNLAKNKKANFDFKIIEELEAGLVLTGQEVKSVKLGHLSLKGAFISFRNGQAWIKNMFISPYTKAGHSLASYNPNRDRPILLHRQQIRHLANQTQAQGLTIVPISVYITRRLVKVKIALAKGKKKFDKRADIKKREIDRKIANKLKSINN